MPENTLVAFRNSVAMGVDVIEIDFRPTKDKEIVILHDATVDRTTDGTGAVKDMTLEEVKQLDAGSYVGEEFAGEQIPTYAEALETVKGTGVRLLLDIKDSSQVQQIVEVTEQYNMIEQVIVGPRSVEALKEFKAINPDLLRGSEGVPETHLRRSRGRGCSPSTQRRLHHRAARRTRLQVLETRTPSTSGDPRVRHCGLEVHDGKVCLAEYRLDRIEHAGRACRQLRAEDAFEVHVSAEREHKWAVPSGEVSRARGSEPSCGSGLVTDARTGACASDRQARRGRWRRSSAAEPRHAIHDSPRLVRGRQGSGVGSRPLAAWRSATWESPSASRSRLRADHRS